MTGHDDNPVQRILMHGAGSHHDSPDCDLTKSHCWEHGDERIPRRVYVICFECGHVWTKHSLRWRYIREHVSMWRKKDEWNGRRYGPMANSVRASQRHLLLSGVHP